MGLIRRRRGGWRLPWLMEIALLLLSEYAVRCACPGDPGGVAESEEGADVGFGWEFHLLLEFATGHDCAERVEVRPTGTWAPVEPGVIYRLVAGVHHGHCSDDASWLIGGEVFIGGQLVRCVNVGSF